MTRERPGQGADLAVLRTGHSDLTVQVNEGGSRVGSQRRRDRLWGVSFRPWREVDIISYLYVICCYKGNDSPGKEFQQG